MFQMISTMPFSLTSILFIYLGQEILFPTQVVVCLYDKQYKVGIIMEVSTGNLDVKVKFMRPKFPAP